MGARIMTHRPILLVLAMFVVAACSRSEPDAVTTKPASGKPVVVDGSSTVWLVSKAVAEEFPRTDGTATVEESGTTGGFRKFCHGEIDVAGASRPIERDEIEACSRAGIEFLELPIGYDGIAVVVNARNTWVDHLTVAELRAMWRPEASGVVARWRDVRASFPDRPLHLFGPGSDSGTFDYFTLAIVGAQRASRRDYTASEDDAVLVKGVIGDEEALGYFGFAYYSANKGKLRIVPIDDEDPRNGDGPDRAIAADGRQRQVPAAVTTDPDLRQHDRASPPRGRALRRAVHEDRARGLLGGRILSAHAARRPARPGPLRGADAGEHVRGWPGDRGRAGGTPGGQA
jgi:phosphate binding protein